MNTITAKINTKNKKPLSIMSWSWVFLVLFFLLSFIDVRFALAGFICMAFPIAFAVAGKGKRHCSHYCPRGSFFGKFLPFISLKKPLPEFMNTKWFKTLLLVLMFTNFGVLLYQMGWGYENIGRAIFKMMLRSFLIGLMFGIISLPRSWCKVCPMGYAAGMIRDVKK
jgi:hypothetical protein